MISTIRQKIINFTLSFLCLLSVISCQKENHNKGTLPNALATPPNPVNIAVLMPLSGPSGATGKQYSALIKMGMQDGLKSDIAVTTYDGADEKQILYSMNKIVANKTDIILGPINSPLTSFIYPLARKHNIIVITLSNNPALADDKLFIFGHAPLKQLDRIINYYLDNNYKNFISLLPAGHYSQTVAKVMRNLVIEKYGTLVRTEFYGETPESIDKSVKLVSENVDRLNEMEDNKEKPVVFLADDSKNLNLVFDSINKNTLDKKAIITGDNRIDIDMAPNIDISFTGSLNSLNNKVKERAAALGINHMTFMHTMAYDLGRMTANRINENYSIRNFLASMNSRKSYIGISGEIYFVDSIAQRHYDIINREANEYETISSMQSPSDNNIILDK